MAWIAAEFETKDVEKEDGRTRRRGGKLFVGAGRKFAKQCLSASEPAKHMEVRNCSSYLVFL